LATSQVRPGCTGRTVLLVKLVTMGVGIPRMFGGERTGDHKGHRVLYGGMGHQLILVLVSGTA